MKEDGLSKNRLQGLLDYDPTTGVFHWKVQRSNRMAPGSIAGCVNDRGYVQIRFNGYTYLAQRLAWLLTYGVWPVDGLDHVNGNKADNRIENLREATNRKNQQNQYRHRDGRLVGAHPVRGRPGGDHGKLGGMLWKAQIQIRGKKRYLGCFPTEAAAHEVYLRAESMEVTS